MFTCIAVVGGMLLMGCGQTSVPDEIADSSEKKKVLLNLRKTAKNLHCRK